MSHVNDGVPKIHDVVTGVVFARISRGPSSKPKRKSAGKALAYEVSWSKRVPAHEPK